MRLFRREAIPARLSRCPYSAHKESRGLHPLRNVLVRLASVALIAFSLTACGAPSSRPQKIEVSKEVNEVRFVNPIAAADGALRRQIRARQLRFIVAAIHVQEQPHRDPVEPESAVVPLTPRVTAVAATTSYPYPVSSSRCPDGPVKDEIRAVFGGASDWAESIAWRESNCQPTARNASGSAGVFQLLGHDDLLRAACPGVDSGASWAIADCNIRAAKSLYDGAGVGPWRL